MVLPQLVKAETLGLGGKTAANSKVNLALIGCGVRGMWGAFDYLQDDRVKFVAFCDPNRESIFETRRKYVQEGGLDYDIPTYRDFRTVVRDGDVDAVHVATPDHWHVPISLVAARAGKDVYCEKPLGLSLEQALAAREIVHQHDRVFQYGTQNRSGIQVRRGIEMVLDGVIGKVRRAYVWAPEGIAGGFAKPELPVPDGFDYDLWLGPAPEAPFSYDRCVRRGENNGIFHIYDYAIGFLAGWGAHPIDQFQWWADQHDLGVPVHVQGRATLPEKRYYRLFDTITRWDFECTYANGFGMRFMDTATMLESDDPNIPEVDPNHGSLFVGDSGWILVYRGGWKFSSPEIGRRARDEMKIKLPESSNHARDFIDAIVGRHQPVSNLESAIRSDVTCHLCDISGRLDRPVQWDPGQETIVNDPEAVAMMHREMRSPWSLDMAV